ncbi:MAG: response regulator transcription factor [Chitinophagaceae bacterium]|nr:response regulator transcription factor [Oligoflexus sp.]
MTTYKPMILVVDDEAMARTMASKLLEKAGFLTHAVETGEECFLFLAIQIPDAILLDMLMPGMSGMEVLEKLRANALWKSIPVLAVTAKGQADFVKQAVALGVDDFIVKPFHSLDLIARVKKKVLA